MSKRKPNGVNPLASPKVRTCDVVFSDETDYPGVTATLTMMSPMEFRLKVRRYFELDLEERAKVIRQFGDGVLLSWNVIDGEGNEVPATGAGLLTQTEGFILDLMTGWTEAVSVPAAPLEEP